MSPTTATPNPSSSSKAMIRIEELPGPGPPVECEVRVRVKTDDGDRPAEKRIAPDRTGLRQGWLTACRRAGLLQQHGRSRGATDRLGIFRLRGLPHGPLQLGLRRNRISSARPTPGRGRRDRLDLPIDRRNFTPSRRPFSAANGPREWGNLRRSWRIYLLSGSNPVYRGPTKFRMVSRVNKFLPCVSPSVKLLRISPAYVTVR